jgi:SAM-dependent methyltransferase
VTRALTDTLPFSVAITATDLNPAMLERAKTHPGLERVQWQEADALYLPFPDQTFDYVVCQFEVMFFPDKPAGLREAYRVLQRGGQLLFNVWDDREGTIQDLAGIEVGRILLRDPATFLAPKDNDIEAVKADLAGAGFGSISVKKLEKQSYFGSAREAAISSCHGGLLRAQIEMHAPERLEEITDAAAAAIAARYGDGPIDAPLRAPTLARKEQPHHTAADGGIRRMKAGLVVCLAMLLTGCVADKMRSYVGMDIRSVELSYGPPINEIDLGNGSRAF